ncbi:olfactory receptor 5AR1-like [Anomaloglossus baeobatrachus]|uniref:olfactory receptor 5AR1-like n=1 Tax=Anomaloglossus baeobatrachus TaxID=238106 RepID=UPI003F501633
MTAIQIIVGEPIHRRHLPATVVWVLAFKMISCDNTTVLEFHILAFSTSGDMTYITFIGFLLIYLLVVCGNLLIASLVTAVPQLHTPMYFLLCNLSIVDATFISTIFPNLLSITLTADTTIYFSGCMTQLYFFILCVDEEILILTCMAYDRYVAICSPLHYPLLMSKKMCIVMAASSLLMSTLNSLMFTLLTYGLLFCRSSEINHFFCEIRAIMSLSSSDTTSLEMVLFIEDICLVFLTFLLFMFSYLHIISSILKIRSLKGRFKTFSSCSSHLTSVVVFYGPILFLYMKSLSDHSSDEDKFTSLLYVAAVPMLNPIVYSLRNKEVKGAIRQIVKVKWNRF